MSVAVIYLTLIKWRITSLCVQEMFLRTKNYCTNTECSVLSSWYWRIETYSTCEGFCLVLISDVWWSFWCCSAYSRRVDLNSVLEGCVFVFVGVWKRELNLLASAVWKKCWLLLVKHKRPACPSDSCISSKDNRAGLVLFYFNKLYICVFYDVSFSRRQEECSVGCLKKRWELCILLYLCYIIWK